MSYTVRIAAAPTKYLEKLRDKSLLRRLTQSMKILGENPRPNGSVKLAGPEPLYRIRVGDYRIIYEIRESELLILVVLSGTGARSTADPPLPRQLFSIGPRVTPS